MPREIQIHRITKNDENVDLNTSLFMTNMLVNLILTLFIFNLSLAEEFPKIIWVYWDKDIASAPLVTQLCLNTMRVYGKQTGWEVRVLQDINLESYITDIQRYRSLFKNTKTQITREKKADFLRFLVLAEHGGVWADMNIILVQNLSWIDKISQEGSIVNKKGDHPDVLTFSYDIYGGRKEVVIDSSTKQQIKIAPGSEIWFIAALPKTKLMQDWLTQFEKTLLIGYQATIKKHNEEGILLGHQSNGYLMGNRAFQAVIQRKQLELDRLRQQDKPRAYAVHFYKVWTISGEDTAFRYSIPLDFSYHQIARLYVQFTCEETAEWKRFPRYFLKLIGPIYTQLQRIVNRKSPPRWFEVLQLVSDYTLICPSDMNVPDHFVVKDSVVDKFLLQFSQRQEVLQIQRVNKAQIAGRCRYASEYNVLRFACIQLIIILVFIGLVHLFRQLFLFIKLMQSSQVECNFGSINEESFTENGDGAQLSSINKQ